jgi:hypothetical protein
MSKQFKVIISLTKIEVSPDVQEGLSCKLNVDGAILLAPVPFREPLCLEFAERSKHITVSFQKDNKEIASGELRIPSEISSNLEVETTEKLRTSTIHNGRAGKELQAEFSLTFINSGLYKAPVSSGKKAKGSPVKMGSSKKAVATSNFNTSGAKVDTHRSRSRGGSKERSEHTPSNLDNYLNRIVDKHFEEAKNRIGNDIVKTEDCVHLNKFENIRKVQLINSQVLNSPGRTYQANLVESTEIDNSASPQKLKEKFASTGRSKSPNRGGNNPDMTSILMDSETRRYVNEYKNQMEYLRNIIYVLDLKLGEQETYKREVSNLRHDNEKGNQAREELRKTLLETTQDLKEESDKFNRLILDHEAHNKDVLRGLKDAHNEVDDLQTKLHAQEIRNGQLDADNLELRAKVKAGEIYKSQLQRVSNEYMNAEKHHADTLLSLGKRIEELDGALNKVAGERTRLRDENGRLLHSVSELKVQLTQEKSNNGHLSDELENLNNKLRLTQGSIEILKGIQEQRDSIVKDLGKLKQHNDSLVHQIENMERQFSESAREQEMALRLAREELLKASRRAAESEQFVVELKNGSNKARKEAIELKNHIITLEQLLCVKEDVYSQLQAAEGRLDARNTDCEKMRSLLDANAGIVEGLNDKTIELEKLVIYLKNGLVDKDDVSVYKVVHPQPQEADHRTQGEVLSLHLSD